MRHPRLVAALSLTGLGPLVLAGGLLALAGCVSFKRTAPARFFVLRALVQPDAQTTGLAPSGGVVGLLPVRIPGALERPQLVSWTAANELRIDEFDRWAEPLDQGATRALAEDLAALLPRDRIVSAPWPMSTPLRCRVATELRLFGPQPNGQVRLEADFAVLAAREERVLARRSFVASRAPAAAASPGASVEAMSELVAELAKEVAETIQALPAEKGALEAPAPTP